MLNLGGILWHYGNAAESSGTASFTGLKEATFADFSLDGDKLDPHASLSTFGLTYDLF